MGLLKKKKTQAASQAAAPLLRTEEKRQPQALTLHSPAFTTALSKYIGIADQRQFAFSEAVDDSAWRVDFSKGELSFGDRCFRIHFLGTESYVSSTWLWACENVNRFDESIVKKAREFYDGPLMAAFEDLRGAPLKLDECVSGRAIASIVSASVGRYCYFRCPYSKGAAYVLVEGAPDSVFYKTGPERVASIIGGLVTKMPLSHKILAESIFRYNGAEIRWEGGGVKGTFAGGGSLSLSFDGSGKIAALSLQ
jgi:hypothetical protein